MAQALHVDVTHAKAEADYYVRAERDGRFWMVTVPAVDRATQARNLREVDPMARDLIRIMRDLTDAQAADLTLNIDLAVPAATAELLAQARRLAAESDSLRRRSALALRSAARGLHEDGIPIRDIGSLLGVSHQRAHQLVTQELEPLPAE